MLVRTVLGPARPATICAEMSPKADPVISISMQLGAALTTLRDTVVYENWKLHIHRSAVNVHNDVWGHSTRPHNLLCLNVLLFVHPTTVYPTTWIGPVSSESSLPKQIRGIVKLPVSV